jgi:hypothetical protein
MRRTARQFGWVSSVMFMTGGKGALRVGGNAVLANGNAASKRRGPAEKACPCCGMLVCWAVMKPHRATTVLVLGILSIVACQPLGIAAWVMGNNDLREMNGGLMDPSGRDTTSAGRICGIIGTVLFIVWFAVMIVMFAAMGVAAYSTAKSTPHGVEMTPIPTH